MKIFRIGTRQSPLALAQTEEVMRELEFHHPLLKGRLDVIPMKTSGDSIVDRSLTDIGGKSLFTKEIEKALLKGDIDMAVHSMKDMATEEPLGLCVPAMLEREDPRDALITRQGKCLGDFPEGALFGTSSLRRQAFVLNQYPHLQTVPLRGNVLTRLQKIENGDVDATLLAVAGLKRLGLLEKATKILSLEDFLPAAGQGAIGIQCREEDQETLDLLMTLNHFQTFQVVTAERAFLRALNGSCRTPIAAYATLKEETLFLKGMISDPQGHNLRFISHKGPSSHPEELGREAAQFLQDKK